MPQVRITDFPGYGPDAASLRKSRQDYAKLALNADFSVGGIRAVRAPEYISRMNGIEFTRHENEWISGGRNYLSWRIDDIAQLFFNQDGRWLRRALGETVPLFFPRPDKASVQSMSSSPRDGDNSSGENYRFSYVLTWIREAGGLIEESGPSEPVEIVRGDPGVRVFRPNEVPHGCRAWKVYRISLDHNPTSDYQLVAELSPTQSEYEDVRTNEELSGIIPTIVAGADGEPVVYEAPPDGIQGIAGPFYGMLFAWKGVNLYSSDVGVPSAWPGVWRLRAAGEIHNVCNSGTEPVVMTSAGPQRLLGATPGSLYLSEPLSRIGSLARRACAGLDGRVVYLSKEGWMEVVGTRVKNCSATRWGRNGLGIATRTA